MLILGAILKIGQKLTMDYPCLQLLIMEGAGHCPHDEIPGEFNQNVLQWLEVNLVTTPQKV